MSNNKHETLYKHETECGGCGTIFTADVELGRHQADVGDYLPSWEYEVPAHCEECAEEHYIPVRRMIDPDEAYLPWWNYGRVYLLGRDPAPDPRPTQDEQVEMVLNMVEEVTDPIDGGVDWIVYGKEDMSPFWWARVHLNDEHYTELSRRAQEEYGVDIDELADRGEQYVRENDIPECDASGRRSGDRA